jgi:Ca2+-binding RTX toxin-like protein
VAAGWRKSDGGSRRWRGLTAAFAAICVCSLAWASAAAAGPVILGGDDLTAHGSQDGSGNNQQGWLYMEKAIGNMKPNVTRPNDNSIAALGSAPAPPTSSGNAGAAIGAAADKNGMTVQYFNSAAEINTAFAGIADGSYQPAIVWVAGDDASNDLGDTGCEGAGTEGQAITDNAGTLNTFVSEGGGLMSHGTCYPWLTALLPTVTTVDGGGSGDLFLTPEGQAAFPGLSDADINAGPWHNHFEGDFGGLQVLARSNAVDDSAGNDAAVILGGSAVDIVPPPPPPPPPPVPQAAPCSNAIFGDSKGNNLQGTTGPDLIKGLLGNDKLNGLGGDDCIRGGPGRDKVQGGDGDDQLNGGQKPDKVGGGSGADLIKVRAGRIDVVSCGSGNDTVRAGAKDIIAKDCEKVTN